MSAAVARAARLVVLHLAVVVALSACAGGEPRIEVVGAPQASVPVAGASQIVLTLANTGDGRDRLVAATTDAALGVEIHETRIEDGRAAMAELAEVDLDAGEQVRFRPGELHLMVVAPDASVQEGGTFELRLTFERSDPLTVEVAVVPLLDLSEGAFDQQDPTDTE